MTQESDNRQAFIAAYCKRDLDAYIKDLDERTTRSAANYIAEDLRLMVYRVPRGWLARVYSPFSEVIENDESDDLAVKLFDTISEAAAWGADQLSSLVDDTDEAVQQTLDERMAELSAQIRSDNAMPRPFCGGR